MKTKTSISLVAFLPPQLEKEKKKKRLLEVRLVFPQGIGYLQLCYQNVTNLST